MNKISFSFEENNPQNISYVNPKFNSLTVTEDKTSDKTAYLTFDDGPSEFTPHLLEILKQNGVNATFFITFMSEDTPEKRAILKQEINDGNAIGVHTWSHDYYRIYANEENFLYDFEKMRKIIRDATGITPNISRFPGGTGNTVSIIASCGHIIMPTLLTDLKKMGIKPFDWNAGGQDADVPHPTSRQLIQDIIENAQDKKDIIILLHDTHQFTINAVPELIKVLRGQGYTFKKLTPDSPEILEHFATKDDILTPLRKTTKILRGFIKLLELS